MKSFHTIKKLSYILAGMGVMASAHAIDIDTCGTLGVGGATYDLIDDIVDIGGGTECLLLNATLGITLNFKGHSITNGGGGADVGVRITGNNNDVRNGVALTTGTVDGYDQNILIEATTAVFVPSGTANQVHGLNVRNGRVGVAIEAGDAGVLLGKNAFGNFVYDMDIRDVTEVGIELRATNGRSVINNVIFNNDIKDITDTVFDSRGFLLEAIGIGVGGDRSAVNENLISKNNIRNIRSEGPRITRGMNIRGESGGTADNNRIEGNTFREIIGGGGLLTAGVELRSFGATPSSASLNTVFDNRFEDMTRGIRLTANTVDDLTSQNIIFKNRFTNVSERAIELDPVGSQPGSVALNSVSFNTASLLSPSDTYCDGSEDFNNWGFNFIGLVPVTPPPDMC